MKKSPTHQLLNQIVPPLAVWAIGKLVQTPKVREAVHDIDHTAIRSMKRVRKNAASNKAWLAAGVSAIAVGVVLMAKATREK
ncbi:MAG TPA: hypothetical protein VJ853_05775 [Thermoanaerobaculia bacterium]|nr:hypothetical protein [Thermoanaerobaculia bacterium]